jgi:predicted Zn-dependent protease
MCSPMNEPTTPPVGRRRLLVGVLAGVALVAAGWFAWQSVRAGAERRRALDDVRANRYAEAEPVLRRLHERDPDDVTVVMALVESTIKGQKLVAEVEPLVTRWCELDPGNAEPWKLRLDVWLRLKRHDRALQDGQRVLELEPNNEGVRRTVARLLLVEGRPEDARRLCRRLLDDRPGDAELRVLLATIDHALGRPADAARGLDELLAGQPGNTSAGLLRGMLFLEANPPEPERAIPLFRDVIARSPDPDDRSKARYQLSLALARAGRPDEAGRVLAELRRRQQAERLVVDSNQQPDNLALHVRAARALFDIGRTPDALARLDRVLARDAAYAPAHRALADYYDRQGRPDQAREHRRKAGTPAREPDAAAPPAGR